MSESMFEVTGMREVMNWLKPGTQSRNKRPGASASGEALQEVEFETEGGVLTGKLFAPADAPADSPLLVLLHGCGQTVDEFATATRIVEHAEEAGFLVFLPAQCATHNASRCWNWYSRAHQQRGEGEPALIAHGVREIIATHDVDPRRVYVGGLSAGGAMAVIMGQAYPDLFAAVGVHSGVAYGSAVGAVSALHAMRHGPGSDARNGTGPTVPTIVFHGLADTTVHQAHGKRIIEQCLGGTHGGCRELPLEARDDYVRTVFADARGRLRAEHWEITEGGHAWSGGEAGGSFSDPRGPDASGEMLRFFDAQRLRPRVASGEVR